MQSEESVKIVKRFFEAICALKARGDIRGKQTFTAKYKINCCNFNTLENESVDYRFRIKNKKNVLYLVNMKKSNITAKFPVLKSQRLLLRQFQDNDLESVFYGLSHPEVIRYYGISFQSLEATKEQMRWFRQLEKEGTGVWWAVCSSDNKTFYGAGGFNNISKEHRKAEIGFWLLPEFWQQGIMSEAMPIICDYGFNQLGLHRIEGYVDTENTACKKAIGKSGFKYEGTMRECEIQSGRFISLDIYAKLIG